MTQLQLSVGEPFTSPAFNSNFVVFANEWGNVIAEENGKEYLRKACTYAKHYRVYLVPERFVLMGYQCLCLISPEGRVIGAQKATHFNTANRVGAKRSSTMEVWNTEFGGIFLCVDVDIYRPEIGRIAHSMGAQIIVCVQQIGRGDYGSHMVVTGAWNASQLNGLFVVAVCNQFNCVCAPVAVTPRQDGFIVPPNLKLPLTARFRVEQLEKIRDARPALSRKLYAVHRAELGG